MSRFGGVPVLVEEDEVSPEGNRFGGEVQQTSGKFGGVPIQLGDEDYRLSAREELGDWDRFWHSFSKAKGFTESASNVLDQTIPMGRVQVTDPESGDLDIKYIPPSPELLAAVKAGDDEGAAEILNKDRDIRLQQRFPHLYEGGKQIEGTEDVVGDISGVVVDPSSLLPIVGKTLPKIMAVSSAFGAADGYLYSKGKTGKADPTQVGLGAAIGAALPWPLKKIGQGLGIFRTKATVSLSNKMLDKYEKELTAEMAQGVSPDIAKISAKNNSGLYDNGVDVDELYKATGRTEPAFTGASAAREALNEIEQQAANNWLSKGVLAVGKAVEPFIGTVSTRVRNISPKIFNTLRKLDLDTHVDVHKYYERLDPFSRQISKLKTFDEKAYDIVKKGLFGEDFTRVGREFTKLAKADPKTFGNMADNFAEVRKVLDEVYDGYKGSGYKLKKVKEYFPKLVTSPEGLGVVRHSLIKKTLLNKEKRLKRPLTRAETASTINGLIKHGGEGKAVAKVSKAVRARKFDFMTDEMIPHYADINDGLHAYVRQGVHDIQRRRWLSTNGAKFKGGRGADPKGHDLEYGIGDVVGKEVNRLNLSGAEEEQLLKALRARFGAGERASSTGFQHFKNIGYGTTLGNIFSAITQIGDNAFGMYINGVRNHLRGMFGSKIIKKTDIGLSEISEDLVNDVSKTKKFLDFTLKWSGFSSLDRFGKESLLNGAMHKYKGQLKTDKGRRNFVAKWGKYFEGEMPALMKQLKAGKFDDDNVRLLLWHTLADIQPIGLSEMPEKYLNHPNGRIFYMLKTFTIKQFDIMRREIFQEIKKGNHLKAAKNTARFALLFGLINGSADVFKDIISGKDIELEDTLINNMVKLVGISRYQTSKMAKDGIGQVLAETLIPPMPFIDKPFTAVATGKPEKALEAVPLVGKLISRRLRED